ncbi:MAG: GNAT family N-acetyltransferase, partial [Planctomycetes bacterium]|nr:GNAT family N-acetyltransferase [Planctomycetota bacterium]
MTGGKIRIVESEDREWIKAFITEHWGVEMVVAHGVVYHPHRLPGFWVAGEKGEKHGLLTYTLDH